MPKVARPLRGPLPVLPAVAALAITAAAATVALPARAQPLAPAAPAAGALTVTRAAEWWLSVLGLPRAWRSAPGKGAGVTVAVLSTGVDRTHRDLTGSVTAGPDYSGTGRHAGGPFWGAEGTAVASLIAGHGHGRGGAGGITGIAPGAKILSVQVTVEYNDNAVNSRAAVTRKLPDAIAAGIRYAVSHGARVIALPLDPGTLGPAGADPAAAGGSKRERAAVAAALASGVLLVAPAGDNGAAGNAVSFPAAYPGVVAVGATARDGKLAPFTSTRRYVALTAPGAGTIRAAAGNRQSQTAPGAGLTVAAPGGGYQSLASTDMAAALTAGVAALIRSRYPSLTVPQVTKALEQGTARHGRSLPAGSGHGALDAATALTAAAAIAAPPRPKPAVRPSPATPARGQAGHQATPATAAARPGSGSLVRSLLVDLVVGACGLIAILVGTMMLTGSRRKRALAAPRPAQPHTPNHARPRTPLALPPASADAPRRPAWPHAAPGRTTFTARPGRGRRLTDSPPWGPARPPESPLPTADAADAAPAHPPARPPSVSQPPWELFATDTAPALPAADIPTLPVTSTGPMYVWNPASTGPQRVLPEEETS